MGHAGEDRVSLGLRAGSKGGGRALGSSASGGG